VNAMHDDDLGRELEQLHLYHDGELGAFARWRFERRLARRPALRAELDALRSVSRAVASARFDLAPAPQPRLDVWAQIAPSLAAADVEREREAERPRFGLAIPRWVLGSGALAAAALVAVLVVVRGGGFDGEDARSAASATTSGGVVRYLDSGGRAVMVFDDPNDDVTIVWTMDAA